jgi:hypothetical protein
MPLSAYAPLRACVPLGVCVPLRARVPLNVRAPLRARAPVCAFVARFPVRLSCALVVARRSFAPLSRVFTAHVHFASLTRTFVLRLFRATWLRFVIFSFMATDSLKMDRTTDPTSLTTLKKLTAQPAARAHTHTHTRTQSQHLNGLPRKDSRADQTFNLSHKP